MRQAVVLSTGAYLPERILTNRDLERMVDTTHEWILERTGIEQRHIADDKEFTSDLAARAGADAMRRAGVDPQSIDLVLVATTTPDHAMPSAATRVQHKLGITRGAAMDLNAACSGFVYALAVARGMVASGQAKRLLVIGAEIFSRIVDWNDRTTCILFGDGAGALLLEAQESKRGLLYTNLYSDGQYAPMLTTNTAGHVTMAGKDVYRHAVAKMPEAVEAAMQALALTVSGIDWLVPHQANLRILSSVGERLGLPKEKVVTTVAQHANTSAASIPLALHTACADGRIRPGQLVVCPAMGAGFTWGSAAIQW
jgi:3-oxoacyl-[acyl-carrier-protein] synthase-3